MSHSRRACQDFSRTCVVSVDCARQTVVQYAHHLRQLEAYLRGIGLEDLRALSPVVVSGFFTDRSRGLHRTRVRDRCGIVRVFLRYLHRQGLLARDLSGTVEAPPVYRLATIPRSITWDEVRRMLETVDRRTVVGRRDYAMLLLLVTYGLRAREVAALTLDDVDWRHDRLRVPERKAGHSTAYPLSPLVGQAILEYLKTGRPDDVLPPDLLSHARAVRADHAFGRVLSRRPLPPAGRDCRPASRLAYVATHLRPAPRRCRDGRSSPSGTTSGTAVRHRRRSTARSRSKPCATWRAATRRRSYEILLDRFPQPVGAGH